MESLSHHPFVKRHPMLKTTANKNIYCTIPYLLQITKSILTVQQWDELVDGPVAHLCKAMLLETDGKTMFKLGC